MGANQPPPATESGPEDADRPNILFVTVDNLGRESVGYYGNDIFQTPNLDRLAGEGVVFDDCYIGTPLCTPARCGWNTGRHAYRVGLNDQVHPDPEAGLAREEVTIAEVLGDVGYDTALFGKWNLGYDEQFNPVHYGYDEFFGSTAGHCDYYSYWYDTTDEKHLYRGTEPVHDDEEGYIDRLFTEATIEYLRERRASATEDPFYVNLNLFAPHGPYQTPPGYPETDDDDLNYQYMVEYLDACLGRVVAEIDRLGMAEDTLIVFLSDQGGSRVNDYGRSLSEDSLKVICNARWPDTIPAGIRSESPWMHYDLFATFASVAGAELPDDRIVDARDVWPLFVGEEIEPDRPFHWTTATQHEWTENVEDAIRVGSTKLHMTDEEIVGLYDLSGDPQEMRDLSSLRPELAAKLRDRHLAWKRDCEDQQTSTHYSTATYTNDGHQFGY